MEADGIKDEDVELELLKEVPLSFARSNGLLPLRRENSSLKCIIASGEGAMLALRDLGRRMGLDPVAFVMAPDKVRELINRHYGRIGTAEEVMGRISGEDLSSIATEFQRPKDILELTEDAPIIRLLNALLQEAVKERASDIHIEPYENELDVRIRVDGALRSVLNPPKIIQDALISRVKIMAGLDIAEKRLPQDGRIRLLIGGRDIDIRVSVLPTMHGERAVMRLLDRMQSILGLKELGLDAQSVGAMEEHLKKTSGILLVTGPTGSGKTTTLYAALNSIHTEEKNIITVEDPVEYQLKGVGQIQVNPKVGLTFAAGLRSILRQDPDVIMVGEIRDKETAEIAIQASLTGHLVLSTLHTNDAASAVTRLLDMEIEPFLAASSISAVLAQRLLRLLCPHCKRPYKPSAEELSYFSDAPVKPSALYKAAGCPRCNATGYLGRTGVFELLAMDAELRKLVSSKSEVDAITAAALKKGMRTLRIDGLSKARAGLTTLEEVLRVTEKSHADI